MELPTETINETAKKFTGEILQVPPIHSAIKQKGKPVYLLARKGVDVKLWKQEKLPLRQFEITTVNLPVVSFRVVCTTGTYIRSLANDFGVALGCGAYLSSLCRTRIGNFTLAESVSIDEFIGQFQKNRKLKIQISFLELYLQESFLTLQTLIYEKSNFYNTAAYLLQHLYDVCMVWPFKSKTDELAAWCKLVSYYPHQLGNCFF